MGGATQVVVADTAGAVTPSEVPESCKIKILPGSLLLIETPTSAKKRR